MKSAYTKPYVQWREKSGVNNFPTRFSYLVDNNSALKEIYFKLLKFFIFSLSKLISVK